MDSKCEVCLDDVDMLTYFTKYQVCGKCVRTRHRRAVS